MKIQHCDIVNKLNGMQFLPLDKSTFLKVQCFMADLEANYDMIRHIAFMFNEHLVWSGIPPDDMQIIYQYIVNTLLPAHLDAELLTGGSIPRNSPFTLYHGKFIIGPENLKTASSIGKIPTVHLNSESLSSYHFVVYRILSASICLFIPDSFELTLDFFKSLDQYIAPLLAPIVSEIAEFCSQKANFSSTSTSDVTPRFIYFNKFNLAYKSTVHLDTKRNGNVSVTNENLKLIADINKQKEHLEFAGETIMKTMHDCWVVGKISNMREVYVVLQQKNASLVDVSGEVDKLCKNELKGIFFHNI